MEWVKLSIFLCLLLASGGCEFDPAPEGMVLVPAGPFAMGTDREDKDNQALSLGLPKPWYADESPERRVSLRDYYIDKYEVTNRQYYIFCQATDYKPPPVWGGMKYPEGTDDLPVTAVNYYDAFAYAEWAGKRLPTEEEWEKAARGPDGLIYPWGNEFDISDANVNPSATKKEGRGLKPVGSFPGGVSYYGAYDMIGNAWEWVWDYYQPYPGNPYPSPDYGKKFVVVRGMSYLGIGHFPKEEYRKAVALMARASYREKLNPLAKKKDVGFRCVKEKRSLFDALGEKEARKK
ncbi:MAG: SUMF1/EgtB/PvdO family nonheme iron enzyme [Nitrospinae bacterium]|nr:SUMF1/EgtB/PvdO family nonheme iron enzyme [Nitrospinota bacterium]